MYAKASSRSNQIIHSCDEKVSSKPIANKRRALGDITNATTNEHKKIFVKASEADLKAYSSANGDDAQPMELVEDRDYMLRPVDDIDTRDLGNPMHAADIVSLIYVQLHDVEVKYKVNQSYMVKQTMINEKMRSILVDWLVSTTIVLFSRTVLFFTYRCSKSFAMLYIVT